MVLPPIRSLLVVDAEKFSLNRDVQLPGLHTEIRRVVRTACERSGLGGAWHQARFLQSTGDGFLTLLPVEAMQLLIDPFIDHLQAVLAEAARPLRAEGLRLRLRVALHIGPVDDEDEVTAGISTATIDVCRLLECEPLRAALRESDPDATFTAAVVSSEAFDMFVRSGRTGLQPSRFTPIRASVKQFDRPAYLYVATPSRREGAEGDADGTPSREPAAERATWPPSGGVSFGNVSVTGDGAQNVIGSQTGQVRQQRS